MAVSVLLITHEDVGTALLQATTTALGGALPLATTVISVNSDTDPEQLLPRLQQFVNQTKQVDGLLILTDLYGSTPSNIAKNLSLKAKLDVISGLNLPMLIRVMNYANLPLKELSQKAVEGGRAGIINFTDR